MRFLLAVVRWYRRVLPVPGLTLGAICLFLALEGLSMLADFRFRRADQVFADHNPLGGGVCIMAAIVYAAFRVVYFHPLWRPQYRRWLQASPWTVRDPLPDGPVMLVAQDFIVLGLLTLGSLRVPHHGHPSPQIVPLLFLGTWMLVSVITFALVGPRWMAYGLVFAVGGVIRFLPRNPGVSVAIGLAMVVATQIGHYLSLRKFHQWDLGWTDKYGFDALVTSNTESLVEMQQKQLSGWPFDQMAPDLDRHKLLLTPWQGFLLAFMVSWQADSLLRFLAFQGVGRLPFGPFAAMVCMLTLVLSAMRAVIYISGHAPPLGFFGRIATGRIIIPGYDYIFVAPLTTIITGVGGTALLAQLKAPPILSVDVMLFLVIFLITTMPPDLSVFHYTGNHRINPDMKQRASAFLIKD